MNCPGSGKHPMHTHGRDGRCAFCRRIRRVQGGVMQPHKQLTS